MTADSIYVLPYSYIVMDFNSLVPDELVDKMLERLAILSDGKLADLSVHSPIRVIFEALTLALVEYGYRVNQLPDAILVRLLGLSGMQVSLGNRATGDITIDFTVPLSADFTVPLGTEFFTKEGLTYTNEAAVVIPIGSMSGSVPVVASNVGSQYNVGARTVTNITSTVSLGLISAIYNASPMVGGSNPDNQAQSILRAKSFLSESKSLVTKSDYAMAALQLLPDGSRVLPIANLSADNLGITTTPTVHTKILKPDFTPLTPTEKTNIYNALIDRVTIGTDLIISDCNVVTYDIKVIVRIETTANPGDVFKSMRERINTYMNPLSWTPKRSLMYKEIEYLARDDVQVDFVQGAYIGLPSADTYETLNVPMPNEWTFPRLGLFILDMVAPSGVTYSYGYGLFDDEPETPILA